MEDKNDVLCDGTYRVIEGVCGFQPSSEKKNQVGKQHRKALGKVLEELRAAKKEVRRAKRNGTDASSIAEIVGKHLSLVRHYSHLKQA